MQHTLQTTLPEDATSQRATPKGRRVRIEDNIEALVDNPNGNRLANTRVFFRRYRSEILPTGTAMERLSIANA